jgi:hypothetical protein
MMSPADGDSIWRGGFREGDSICKGGCGEGASICKGAWGAVAGAGREGDGVGGAGETEAGAGLFVVRAGDAGLGREALLDRGGGDTVKCSLASILPASLRSESGLEERNLDLELEEEGISRLFGVFINFLNSYLFRINFSNSESLSESWRLTGGSTLLGLYIAFEFRFPVTRMDW